MTTYENIALQRQEAERTNSLPRWADVSAAETEGKARAEAARLGATPAETEELVRTRLRLLRDAQRREAEAPDAL